MTGKIDEGSTDPFSIALTRSAISLKRITELLPQLVAATEKLGQSCENSPASEDQLRYLSELTGVSGEDLRKENFSRAEASRLIRAEIKRKKLEGL